MNIIIHKLCGKRENIEMLSSVLLLLYGKKIFHLSWIHKRTIIFYNFQLLFDKSNDRVVLNEYIYLVYNINIKIIISFNIQSVSQRYVSLINKC